MDLMKLWKLNLTLIRRRIRDPKLKIKYIQIGSRSKTDVAILYIEDIVNKNVLEAVQKRLDNIDIEAVLESSYIEELIERWQLFSVSTNWEYRKARCSSISFIGRKSCYCRW